MGLECLDLRGNWMFDLLNVRDSIFIYLFFFFSQSLLIDFPFLSCLLRRF